MQENVNIRIARIFNTFGPRMHMNDGRVVSNFIVQALQNKDITVYGNGNQTRSFQYVTDLVRGLVMLMNSNVSSPVNIGNPEEHTIEEFASIIKQMTSRLRMLIIYDTDRFQTAAAKLCTNQNRSTIRNNVDRTLLKQLSCSDGSRR